MNADEVCAMIDAVTEGRDYTYPLHGRAVESVSFSEGAVRINTHCCTQTITDPRVMQEIAGLLVAAAATKEKRSNAGQ